MEFIRKVTRTVDGDTRERLLQEASKVEDIRHYVRALMTSEKEHDSQHLAEVDHQLQSIEAKP